MAKLKLDLHEIFNKGSKIDEALEEYLEQAEEKKIKEIEIIPGKGTGQLKRRVLRFFKDPNIKKRYKRLKKDPKNSGRIFIYLY